jgi:hypothetical protein
MSLCGKCNKAINRQLKEKVLCTQCGLYFHGQCVGLTGNEIDLLSGKKWSCERCISSLRRDRRSCDECPIEVPQDVDGPVVLSQLRLLLQEIKKEILDGQKRMETDLLQKLEDMSAIISSQQEVLNRQQTAIDELRSENALLRGKINNVYVQMDELEQYSRRCTLEIQGVPVSRDENLTSTVCRLGELVGLKIDESMVDVAHRLKNGSHPSRPPGVIVKFVRRKDADSLIQSCRKSWRNLNAQRLNFPVDSAIYVNRSLTRPRRKLFGELRRLKKDGLIKDVQVDRYGRLMAEGCKGGGRSYISITDDYKVTLSL